MSLPTGVEGCQLSLGYESGWFGEETFEETAVYFVKESALDAAVEESEGHCSKQERRRCQSWINVFNNRIEGGM